MPTDLASASQGTGPEPQGMEHNPSDPMIGTADEPQNSAQLSEEDQSKLMQIVRDYKAQWSQDRMVLMTRCIENLEFFKGNQFISFAPGDTSFFDAVDWMNQQLNTDSKTGKEDKSLYQYCNNFYQMLATGFVASLAPQVPKSKWEPDDAEELSDTTTAAAAQTLITIIERQNREQSQLKRQLLFMYCMGATFRHTRYIVDGARAGTRTEPVFDAVDMQILPDRWHCFDCGTESQAGPWDSDQMQCPNCKKQMGSESFYPAENGTVIKKVGTREVPNGMVAQNLYSPLEVDADPQANTLEQTPILNLEVEVHLGALRSAYPDMYKEIQAASESELSPNGSLDRIARQQVYSQRNTNSGVLQDQRPTLSRTWIQPWAFDIDDDPEFGKRMRATYPSGLLLINTGAVFLSAREASLTKEWTWAGTHEGFGLYPPSIGDVVVPFQKRYNDMANILHEFMDRCSSGVTLANADLIDTKSMQGKPMLPGVLNLIKLKRTGPPGAVRMADALYQFQFAMHEEAFNYLDKLAYNAQMFAGIPPQVYGGAGDKHVETFGGQEQQLNVAMGKLNIYWENIKEEHAAADVLAVNCAKDNLTNDLRLVISQNGSASRNDYVRLDDLQGSVHAYADTDQGLPVTAAELRQRWMDLITAAHNNPLAQAVFDDPTNQQQAVSALGVPNMVVPGAAMRSKVLQILDKLVRSQAIPVLDPRTNQPTGQFRPSIMPDKDIDDFVVAKQVVRLWCQEHCDLPDTNPTAWQNVLAYFTALVLTEVQKMSELAQQQMQVKMAGAPPQPQKPQIPPDEINDIVQTTTQLMHLPPSATGDNVQGQVQAANTLIKLGDKLMQDGAS